MKLHKDYKHTWKQSTSKGLSIIELLIVFGIVMVVVGITTPVGFRYYQTQASDEAARLVFDALRRAQYAALVQKNDSSFGVYFDTDSFVLFQGESYATRDAQEDELFVLAGEGEFVSSQEVVFTKMTATTSSTTVGVRYGNIFNYIDINTAGRVDKR